MRSVTDNEKWLKEEVEKLYNQYKAVSGDESIKTVEQFVGRLKSIYLKREKGWTREKIEKAYAAHVERTGDIPHTKQLAYAGLPCSAAFKQHMGMNYIEYASKYYPEYLKTSALKRWTREETEEAVNRYIERTGEAPKQKECVKNGLPSQCTFRRLMGVSYTEYTRQHYPDAVYRAYPVNKTAWTREKIDEAYKAYIEEHGHCPNTQAINSGKLPNYFVFRNIMGMTYAKYAWKYYPHLGNGSGRTMWTREMIEEAYTEYVRENGAYPTAYRLSRKVLPHATTFKRVMGMTYSEYAKTHPIDKDNPALYK